MQNPTKVAVDFGRMKTPPKVLAWLFCLCGIAAGAVMIGGLGGQQNKCGAARAGSPGWLQAAISGYFAPVPCDKFFQFPWFVSWYQLFMSLVVAVVLGMGSVHTWRYGVIGMLAPLFYLVTATANAFVYQERGVDQSSARAVLAGAILGAVSDSALIMLLGVRDEDEIKARE